MSCSVGDILTRTSLCFEHLRVTHFLSKKTVLGEASRRDGLEESMMISFC